MKLLPLKHNINTFLAILPVYPLKAANKQQLVNDST